MTITKRTVEYGVSESIQNPGTHTNLAGIEVRVVNVLPGRGNFRVVEVEVDDSKFELAGAAEEAGNHDLMAEGIDRLAVTEVVSRLSLQDKLKYEKIASERLEQYWEM